MLIGICIGTVWISGLFPYKWGEDILPITSSDIILLIWASLGGSLQTRRILGDFISAEVKITQYSCLNTLLEHIYYDRVRILKVLGVTGLYLSGFMDLWILVFWFAFFLKKRCVRRIWRCEGIAPIRRIGASKDFLKKDISNGEGWMSVSRKCSLPLVILVWVNP